MCWMCRIYVSNPGGHLLKYKALEEKDFSASDRIFPAHQEISVSTHLHETQFDSLTKDSSLQKKTEITEAATYCFFLYVALKTFTLMRGDFSLISPSSLQISLRHMEIFEDFGTVCTLASHAGKKKTQNKTQAELMTGVSLQNSTVCQQQPGKESHPDSPAHKIN